jgi:tetratricopeptide (TPR) repeat protein
VKPTKRQRSDVRGGEGSSSSLLEISEKLPRALSRIGMTFAVLITLGPSVSVHADQYIAYSLKVAQERIEQAGDDWRQKESEVASLGGINKVEGFVFDSTAGDLILVGKREEGRVALTLDDLVVALRARFRYNEWPLVSIDPTPDTEKTQMQHVRFEGGIEDTAFGQALFDADYRLKELSMGLSEPRISDFRTAWDREVEGIDSGGLSGQRHVSSRFWFYPITPHVVVREGICVARGLKVGVFTEVLSAEIDGRAVENAKEFRDTTNDAFAHDVSQRFDDLCRTQSSFSRLRGLQELVAVSKALEDSQDRPDVSYWLEKYATAEAQTPRETKVLRRTYDSDRTRLEVSGGVHLTALAMRLNTGDVTALREAVLKMRPSAQAVRWEFLVADWLVSLEPGQVKPEDVSPLFQHAVFLHEQGSFRDAVTLYDKVLELIPEFAEAYNNRANCLNLIGEYDSAIHDCNKAIELNPRIPEVFINRGTAYLRKGDYDQAIADLDKVIALNPICATAYVNRGTAYLRKGNNKRALEDFDEALRLDPKSSHAYLNRGLVRADASDIDGALSDLGKAIDLDPEEAVTYRVRAQIYLGEGDYDLAKRDLDRAIALDPSNAEAYCYRAQYYRTVGDLLNRFRWSEKKAEDDLAKSRDDLKRCQELNAALHSASRDASTDGHIVDR